MEETGEEVPYDDIVKGYEVGKGHYIEVTDEELEAISIESTRTIDIDEFVPKQEIDELYNIRPYYIAPDGKVGADAFGVIRDAIKDMEMVALGRVVLTSREHVMALEPRGKGLMGTLLRYPTRCATRPITSTMFRPHTSPRICWNSLVTSSKRKPDTSNRKSSRTTMKMP